MQAMWRHLRIQDVTSGSCMQPKKTAPLTRHPRAANGVRRRHPARHMTSGPGRAASVGTCEGGHAPSTKRAATPGGGGVAASTWQGRGADADGALR